MCTVSWSLRHGLDLFFNRDDLKTRAPEKPVRLHHTADGTPCLAPTDGSGSGTWLAANSYGLISALLNLTLPSIEPKPANQSRGQIVPLIMDATSVASAIRIAKSLPLHNFAPFSLLLMQASGGCNLLQWNGETLSEITPHTITPPLCSSSVLTEVIQNWRKQTFYQACGKGDNCPPEQLRNYHLQTHSQNPAFGPLVMRPDVATLSFSHISIRSGTLSFQHNILDRESSVILQTQTLSLQLNLQPDRALHRNSASI